LVQFAKLRLSGFKSFVDHTELLIEPGLTGVVGPNGCGKSNLVEAVRWVMGETSARRMRGGEMEDVIFGGTARRPPRNVCEVAVVLDNAGRDAPTAYNTGDELEIVRRIERGHGSGYKVNGKDTRARDVQLLFADIATGAKSTGLVSQGQITQLISARPQDRRHLLEEAAGVSGLHSRRHEAELRLKAAEQNLERLEDVLKTLDVQLQSLQKQAKQAARFRRLRRRIRQTEALLLKLRWDQAVGRLDETQEALAIAENAVAEIAGAVAAATTAETRAAEAVPPLREAEAAVSAELQRYKIAAEQLESEEKRIEQQRVEAMARLAQIGQDRDREQQLAEDAAAAETRLNDERADLEARREDEAEDREAAAARVAEAHEAVQSRDAELTRVTEGIAADEARANAIERQVEELNRRLERLRDRHRQLADQRRQLEDQANEGHALEASAFAVTHAESVLETARDEAEAAEQVRLNATERAATLSDALRQAQSAFDRLTAEAGGLEALMASTGRSDGAAEGEAAGKPLLEMVVVEPGYETAFGAALGDDLSAPAASESEAVARRWASLPAYPEPAPLPVNARPMSVLATLSGSAAAALTRRLSQIGVVEDAAAAARLHADLRPGQRLVTRDGAVWRWDGFVAEADGPSTAATRLSQRNRLAELREELVEAEASAEAAEDAYQTARAEVETAQQNEREARQAVQQAYTAVSAAQAHSAKLSEKAAELRTRLSGLVETIDGVTQEMEETAAKREEVVASRAELPDLAESRARADALRSDLGGFRTALMDARSGLDRLQRDADMRRQRIEAIDAELETWRRRAGDARRQLEELDRRRSETESLLEELAERPDAIAEQRETLWARIDETEDRRRVAEDRRIEADTALAEAARHLKESEGRLSQAREERVRIQGAVAQAVQTRDTLVDRIRERLDVEPDDILSAATLPEESEDGEEGPPEPLPKADDPDALESRLDRLTRELENMGSVNLRAEIECEEMQARIDGLLAEQEDLIAAIGRLRSGIASLNREARERLTAAFDQVNANFQHLFTRLFEGGKAHLTLTDPEDPLETGLDIMASPEGKRMQNLTLLSGGEQTLTACALLFAVFQTNPAPICVLDEVDAPLDDANVDRYCRLLEEFASSGTTRFLVITHHRMTMARMDRLFGVTMMERGISQLVSVDLHQTGHLQAAE